MPIRSPLLPHESCGPLHVCAITEEAIGEVPLIWEDDIVEKYGIRFEHGHMNSLFNRAPPHTDSLLA